jgi:copper transport protein
MTAGLVLGFALPATAHAEVVATSPTSDSTVNGTITEVSVTFDEAVSLVPHALALTTDVGIPVALETPRLSDQGKVLSAQVQDHLARGRYAVAWRAQADDGHLENSTFSFSVAAGAGQAAGTQTSAAPPPLPPAPADPLWPVFVAAGVALAGGVGAGVAVRRGLRVVAVRGYADEHTVSRRDHETSRLPM